MWKVFKNTALLSQINSRKYKTYSETITIKSVQKLCTISLTNKGEILISETEMNYSVERDGTIGKVFGEKKLDLK